MKALTLFLAAAAWAVAGAPAQAADPRVVTRSYQPEEVVVLQGRAGVQATIAFGEDEQIENVGIGDAASWQVTPNKRADLLFVKPLGPRSRTNMTVVTDRHTYLFDLVAGEGAAPVYILRFRYPDEPKPRRPLALGMSAEEAQAAAAPPKEASNPAALNFAWTLKGDRKILPSCVYDDGQATYLSWPARSAIPAILTRNEKGQEGAVNYAVRGDVLVLDSVPKTIVLRAGRDAATLDYAGPPAPAPAAAEAPIPARQGALAAVQPRPEGR
jgi:type IV secretion system protein VirB9